ncbi:ACT domain-containing protein [Frateuria sp.]|uniref:ACT domain-containing protein n=1 Tax=Frateuria sp. TaxID=2211372 RepID=UPI0017EC46CE|nr:ACT domain-containing protein [Frateuria sp.]NUR22554.1 ACT domain-containing protein [Frateuria sp.]
MSAPATHLHPGGTELDALLADLRPRLHPVPRRFLFLSHDKAAHRLDEALMMFREDEGVTLIVDHDLAGPAPVADRLLWAQITLGVESSLDAVGMMAAVSAALAARGISCNPVSAFLHDHVFVPWDRREDALDALAHLSS